MFVDASALVAIILREDDMDRFIAAIEGATSSIYISPLVRYEATVSVARAARERADLSREDALAMASRSVEIAIEEMGAREIAIGPDIGRLALDAAQTYGKAVGHKANLNFGDCFAYACAKAYRLPLLYKGNDFVHTDLA